MSMKQKCNITNNNSSTFATRIVINTLKIMKRKNVLLTACLALLATGNAIADDATWTATTVTGLTDQYFPLLNSNSNLNLTVWNENSTTNVFDDATKTVTFKSYYYDKNNNNAEVYLGGMIGWEVYDQKANGWWNQSKNVDLTPYTNIVIQLNKKAGSYHEVQYAGVTVDATAEGGYSRKDYAVTLGAENSDHFSALTSNFGNNGVMNNVMRVSLRDGASVEGESTDNCGQLQISNVFLTNTLPDWDNAITKTPKANYGTICLPYISTVAGAYIYQITGKSNDNKTIYITPYNGLMQAGVPYIYKALTTNTAVKFYEIKLDGTEVTTPSTNNGLVGVLDDNAVSGENYYVISNDKLYQVNSTVAVKNGAYIDMGQISLSSANGIAIDIAGDNTGISSVNTDNATNNDNSIYTISGAKVSNDQQRGIYIKNGKKYIKTK